MDGFARSLGESLECARKVMINLLSLCAQISLTCPHGICKLVDALVLPILSYGCEMWFWDHSVGTRATAQAFGSAPACAHPDCTCWVWPLVSKLAAAGGQVQAAFEELQPDV